MVENISGIGSLYVSNCGWHKPKSSLCPTRDTISWLCLSGGDSRNVLDDQRGNKTGEMAPVAAYSRAVLMPKLFTEP